LSPGFANGPQCWAIHTVRSQSRNRAERYEQIEAVEAHPDPRRLPVEAQGRRVGFVYLTGYLPLIRLDERGRRPDLRQGALEFRLMPASEQVVSNLGSAQEL
jgi:hypothetical protein